MDVEIQIIFNKTIINLDKNQCFEHYKGTFCSWVSVMGVLVNNWEEHDILSCLLDMYLITYN